jgi:hypothetical protein
MITEENKDAALSLLVMAEKTRNSTHFGHQIFFALPECTKQTTGTNIYKQV